MADFDPTTELGFSVPWTAENAAELRNFMHSTTGKRLLGHFMFRRPTCSEKSDPFKRGVQSAIGEGYDELVHRISFFMNPDKSVTPTK